MIKLNVKKITLNENKMKAIANAASSERLKSFLTQEANIVLKSAWSKIPYNVRSSEPHMRDKYQVMKPSKANFKINGIKYPSCQVRIKPKGKYQVYYAVVTAGKRNGKSLTYSDPNAQPYALENTLKQKQAGITSDAINELLKEIGDINDK